MRLRIEDLKQWIEQNEDWAWKDDPDGLIVGNERFQTVTKLTFDAIDRHDRLAIIEACKQGRDVTHVTRVTGYFSKVSGWNKGKVGELRDRNRSVI